MKVLGPPTLASTMARWPWLGTKGKWAKPLGIIHNSCFRDVRLRDEEKE